MLQSSLGQSNRLSGTCATTRPECEPSTRRLGSSTCWYNCSCLPVDAVQQACRLLHLSLRLLCCCRRWQRSITCSAATADADQV